jgi:transposase InsO family protein
MKKSRFTDEQCHARRLRRGTPRSYRLRNDYNHQRPHSSLGHLTPSEFATRGRNNGTSEAAIF